MIAVPGAATGPAIVDGAQPSPDCITGTTARGRPRFCSIQRIPFRMRGVCLVIAFRNTRGKSGAIAGRPGEVRGHDLWRPARVGRTRLSGNRD